VLEDSGVSVAPPERRRSGRITVKGKVYQEVSHNHRGSDISGDSGSEYEEENNSDEESEVPSEKESDKEVSVNLVIKCWLAGSPHVH
jgi:hypothetical protein